METVFTASISAACRIHSIVPTVSPRVRGDVIYVVLVECIRFLPVWYKLKRSQRRAHIDVVNPVPLQQIYGEQKTKHVKEALTSFDRE